MKSRNLFTRKNLLSALMHIPVGIAVAASILVHPAAMLLTGAAFMLYEIVELYVLNKLCRIEEVIDTAYPELAGFLCGALMFFIALYVLVLFGIPIPKGLYY